MSILVQKFGGTSVSTAAAREHVMRHIERERQRHQLVVVVSAMGRSGDPYATDSLLALARGGQWLPPRERDLLLCCGEIISATTLCSLLAEREVDAVVLTGGQAGIITDEHYGQAQIIRMDTAVVLRELQRGKVVIVAGFQGRTESGEWTTLGRGGSDTSATALGAALGAVRADIYTDVDGILTADPRLVADARPLRHVGYAEMCNLARQGAKVIHPRAVEIAAQANLPLRVRSTFLEEEGTLVSGPLPTAVQDRYVTGIAHVCGITQLSVQARDEEGDMQLQVFRAMAGNGISVDFINVTPGGAVYTVFDSDAPRALAVLRSIGYEPQAVHGCAKVSVIGGGMNGVPGIMASIVEALTGNGITILQSADSNSTIWVLVREEEMAAALRSLHEKFKLHLPKQSGLMV